MNEKLRDTLKKEFEYGHPDFVDITIDEFWRVVDQFRGPMWIKDKHDIWYNTSLDLLK